jgi:hypothetical protein
MFTRPYAARASVIAALAIAVSVAGCGGSSGNGVGSKSASEILAASKAAATSASSVDVIDKITQGPLSFTSHLELASNGGRARVSFLARSFEAIRLGEVLYVRGNAAFERQLSGIPPKRSPGTWLKGSADSGELAQFAIYTSLRRELNLLLSTVRPTKGHTTTVSGQKAIELKEIGKLYAGTLWIATTGKPYPIKLLKHGRESGQITFSGWNEPITLSAPANATTIE